MSPLPQRETKFCEERRCNPLGRADWYCVDCDAIFCESCWVATIAHRPTMVGRDRVGRDRMPHEKTNYYITQRFIDILHPPSSEDEIRRLHEEDEQSTWFG